MKEEIWVLSFLFSAGKNLKREETAMKYAKLNSHASSLKSVFSFNDSFSSKFELMCMGMCRMLSVPVRLPVLAKPWR